MFGLGGREMLALISTIENFLDTHVLLKFIKANKIMENFASKGNTFSTPILSKV